MKTIAKLEALGKREKQRILDENPGLIARVAREVGKTTATVSRVFNGKIARSPEVKAALEAELEKLSHAA